MTDLANAMKNGPLDSSGPGARRVTLLLGIALLLYAALRLIAWHNTVLLDDTDSIVYLGSIDTYHSLDWDAINSIDADSTPFYPAMGAFAKLFTGDTESAARLVSFCFSLCLVVVVALLARKLDGNVAAAFAVFILAVNASMISLSVSVLTEVSYIGTVYLGFYLLWRQIESGSFSIGAAAALGLVFGLAFLNRTEGILYVAAIPIAVFALGWLLRERQKRPPIRRIAGYCTVYVLVFLALAIPQITHVSSKMGAPALNGRVAWQALVTASPGESIDEAMFGLDFADDQIDILYIRENYDKVVAMVESGGGSALNIGSRVRQSIDNIDTIYRDYISSQISPFGFTLAVIGLVTLYLSGAVYGLLYCLFILALLLIGPVAHTSIIPRHLSAAIPMLSLLQGIGLFSLAAVLTGRVGSFSLPRWLVVPGLFLVLLAGLVFPLNSALRPPNSSVEYDPAFLAAPVELIEADDNASAISAQRAFIGFLAGKPFFYAPYTSYEKLLHYLDANNVSHFYVDFERMADYPYIGHFETPATYQDDFDQLWVGSRAEKRPAALFRRRAP